MANADGPKRAGANRRRLTHAESLRRQQEIVRLRDVHHLTWTEVAEKVGMAQKETREAYTRFVTEVAPLLWAPSADEQVAAALRVLDDAAQHLWRIATDGDNDSARVGALRTLVDLAFRELELRQKVGLLPKPLEVIKQDLDYRLIAKQLADFLAEYGVPEEARMRLLAILGGESQRSVNDSETR